MLTYTNFKKFLIGYSYQPTSWSNISGIIEAAQRGNATLYLELLTFLAPNLLTSNPMPEGTSPGIKCSDKISRTGTLEAWLPQAEKIQEASRLFGDNQVMI